MPELVDVAAERAVLAGLCKYGMDVYDDIADMISVNTFTFPSNQAYFRCIDHILNKQQGASIDMPSIWSAAKDLGLTTLLSKNDELKNDELSYIRGLMNFHIFPENVRRLASKLRKLEFGRIIVNQLDAIKGDVSSITGDEGIDHILGLVETPVFDLSSMLVKTSTDGPQRIGDGIDEYIQNIIDNPREMVGISTGYLTYDKAIGGGLRRKTVNLIGARPKIGKTTFADNVALFIAGVLGIPVLNLDTEMSKDDHWNRMIANLSEVEVDDIETGKFMANDFKKKKVFDAIDRLKKIPYDYLSIAGQPFEETVASMRRWVKKKVGLEDSGLAKPCVILYDYLKLMTTEGLSKNMQEYQLLGFQMTTLHNFMVRHGVACLAFIQLNRDGINREDTDVASGSDRLIWLCSNFSIFKKKSDDEMNEDAADPHGPRHNRKLVPIAARHGAGLEDGDYINMNMIGKYAKIIEGRTRNDLYQIKKKGELIDDPNSIPEEDRQF